MTIKRYCKVTIIEGEEEKLRSGYWSRQINSGGATIYGDNVKMGSAQIDYEDLLVVNPKRLGKLLEFMRFLEPIKLEHTGS